jgi:uncharacterized integral membrane protein
MQAFKLLLLILVTIAATLFVVQNTDVTTVRVFFWTVEMSRIVLIVVPLLVGCASGLLLASLVRRSRRSEPQPPHGSE